MTVYRLHDRMDEGINELYCSCGQRLYPDCDMSSVSVVEEFERHLADAHGHDAPSK